MITVIVAGRVERQVGARIQSRRWALNFAREDSRAVQVWESDRRQSVRIH